MLKGLSLVQKSTWHKNVFLIFYFYFYIGGYPIPQYRKKTWQIPKYRVTNRRNTDTAFMIGHVYLKLYPSRVFVHVKRVCTRNQLQALRENVGGP